MTEHRRIQLAGAVVDVVRDGDVLRTADGRSVSVADAVHFGTRRAGEDHRRHFNP